MSDEEYVRSVWEWVQVVLAEPFEGVAEGKWIIGIPLLGFSQIGYDTEDAAWSAARAYTDTVLEEARQLREEMAMIESRSRHSGSPIAHACSGETIGHLNLDVMQFSRWNRILSRLQTIYAQHVRGIKPEALEGK